MGMPFILLPSNNLAVVASKSLATGSANSSFPLSNISNGDVTLPFKAASTGDVRIVFDCGAAVRVDGAFLPMANIPEALAGVRWQGHTSSSWGSPDVDVPITIPDFTVLGAGMTPIPDSPWANVMASYSAANRMKRYWSLFVPSFGSPSDPAAIGELLFGQLTPIWGFSPDENQESHEHGAIVKTAIMGARWAFRYAIRQRHRSGSMVVEGAVLTALRTLEAQVGGTADPFIWVEDEDENLGMLVTLDGPITSSQLAPYVLSGGSPQTIASESVHKANLSLSEVNRGLPL